MSKKLVLLLILALALPAPLLSEEKTTVEISVGKRSRVFECQAKKALLRTRRKGASLGRVLNSLSAKGRLTRKNRRLWRNAFRLAKEQCPSQDENKTTEVQRRLLYYVTDEGVNRIDLEDDNRDERNIFTSALEDLTDSQGLEYDELGETLFFIGKNPREIRSISSTGSGASSVFVSFEETGDSLISISFSSELRQLAVLSNRCTVTTLKTEGAQIAQVYSASLCDADAIRFEPGGNSILFNVENSVYRLSLPGGEVQLLFETEQTTVINRFGLNTENGNILFQDLENLYLYDSSGVLLLTGPRQAIARDIEFDPITNQFHLLSNSGTLYKISAETLEYPSSNSSSRSTTYHRFEEFVIDSAGLLFVRASNSGLYRDSRELDAAELIAASKPIIRNLEYDERTKRLLMYSNSDFRTYSSGLEGEDIQTAQDHLQFGFRASGGTLVPLQNSSLLTVFSSYGTFYDEGSQSTERLRLLSDLIEGRATRDGFAFNESQSTAYVLTSNFSEGITSYRIYSTGLDLFNSRDSITSPVQLLYESTDLLSHLRLDAESSSLVFRRRPRSRDDTDRIVKLNIETGTESSIPFPNYTFFYELKVAPGGEIYIATRNGILKSDGSNAFEEVPGTEGLRVYSTALVEFTELVESS